MEQTGTYGRRDETGIVLANDITEAIRKVISKLNKQERWVGNETIVYDKYNSQKSQAFKRYFQGCGHTPAMNGCGYFKKK